MAHPAETATDAHQFDRRADDVNVRALSTRVGTLEERVHNVERQMGDNTRELTANTVLTKQVHQNTETIVAAVKWMSTTGRAVKVIGAWTGAVGGGVLAIGGIAKLFGLL